MPSKISSETKTLTKKSIVTELKHVGKLNKVESFGERDIKTTSPAPHPPKEWISLFPLTNLPTATNRYVWNDTAYAFKAAFNQVEDIKLVRIE